MLAKLACRFFKGKEKKLEDRVTGDFSGLWRYRVGDYRIISKIEDNVFTVLVVKVGHRKEIYD